jgi:hypothetical protein
MAGVGAMHDIRLDAQSRAASLLLSQFNKLALKPALKAACFTALPSTGLDANVQGGRAMKRAIIWSIAGGILLAAAAALVIAAPERNGGPVFIEGSRPVTEEQVRLKLVSDGWTNVQVVRRGRLVIAMASKDGETDAFAVDAFTGRRLRLDNDDDDDD